MLSFNLISTVLQYNTTSVIWEAETNECAVCIQYQFFRFETFSCTITKSIGQYTTVTMKFQVHLDEENEWIYTDYEPSR